MAGLLHPTCLVRAQVNATVDLNQQSANAIDPYSLSFDDFEWEEPLDLIQLEGAVAVGESPDLLKAIEQFRQRVAESASPPVAAMNLTVLGKLLLQKAREEDDLPAYAESESVLRRAVKTYPEYSEARLALARSLMARHGFHEALELVTQLNNASPRRPSTLAALFDCQVELGDYVAAAKTLESLRVLEGSAPVLARSARLAELNGRNAFARQEMKNAIASAQLAGALPASLVWYQWRLGTLAFDDGKLDHAMSHFQMAQAVSPGDEAVLVGLAKTQFALGDVPAATETLTLAAEGEAPPVLSLLGDVLAFQGKFHEARALWDRCEELMDEEAKVAKVSHAREVAIFLADHGRHPPKAVKLSEIDLSQREDAFAWDCHAWALLKNNQPELAQKAIAKALASQPHDCGIIFHAAVIAKELGDEESSAALLQQIESRNPRFSITYCTDMQKLMRSIHPQP